MSESKRPEYPADLLKAIAEDPERYYSLGHQAARAGDHTAARDMLYGFCEAVDNGKPVPTPILQYLASAFNAYLAVAPDAKERAGRMEHALLLVKRRGNPGARDVVISSGRIYTDVAIAAILQLLLRRGKRSRDSYVRLLEARRVSSVSTITRYEKEYSSLPDWSSQELRDHIRIEREAAKQHLSEQEREQIKKQRSRRMSARERKSASSIRALSWE